MNDWTSYLQSQIFSRIKNEFPQSLKDKYPSIEFGSAEKRDTPAKLPFVKGKIISMVEQGKDLTGKTINAVLVTFQTEVTVNTTEFDANKISYGVIDVLKSMSFEITFPQIRTEDEKIIATTRASRVIGSGDIL